jgi:hypothetical protein
MPDCTNMVSSTLPFSAQIRVLWQPKVKEEEFKNTKSQQTFVESLIKNHFAYDEGYLLFIL